MTHPSYTYLILGAGRQGTAAAYDLARFGDASRIVLADVDPQVANQAAARVNHLVQQDVARGLPLDVIAPDSLFALLSEADGVLSAVPYYYNLKITKAAIDAKTHYCDLGGHTGIVRQQLDLDSAAKEAGISIVPDCGMGPGLIVTMASYVIDKFDMPEEILLYDGGLPQKPQPPWNYQLTFHVNGLTNEMDGRAVYLREGQIAYVDTLTEPEFIDFPSVGKLEADVTSGGTSTSSWTFAGKLQRYENKTLRYPGHFEWLRAFKTLGLFSEQPMEVNGHSVTPRQVFHTLLEPQITSPQIEDLCVIRVVGKGQKGGIPAHVVVDLIDYYDPTTGFTAMERLTGWHSAIMLAFQARGEVAPGGSPVELAVKAEKFMQAIEQRGIHFEVRWE